MLRLIPKWYLDLEASRKPVAVVGFVLIGLVPLLVLAIVAGRDLADATRELELVLAQPVASVAEIDLVRDRIGDIWTRYSVFLICALLWALIVAVGGARLTAIIATNWVNSLAQASRHAAEGELDQPIERDNDSQVGDIQESLSKMLARRLRVSLALRAAKRSSSRRGRPRATT